MKNKFGKKILLSMMVLFLSFSFGFFLNTKESMAKTTEKTITVTKGCTYKEVQEALDENASGKYKLTVKLPRGTYKFQGPLYVYPNTTIIATGSRIYKEKANGAMVESKLVKDKGGYNTNHDITIIGGAWDSTPTKNNKSGTETFRFIHSNNITIKNATLCNVPQGSHLIVFAGVKNAVVENCNFYGYKNYKKTNVPKEAIQLDICHSVVLVPTQQTVKWDDLPCENITIKNSKFHEFSRGIGSHTAINGKLHSNVKILNNKFYNLSEAAIKLYNYKNSRVEGNSINNTKVGILAYTAIEGTSGDFFQPLNKKVGKLPSNYNIVIKKNTIKNSKDTKNVFGDAIRVSGISSRQIPGVTIKQNKLYNTSRYGIYTTYARGVKIDGNTVQKTEKDGIELIDTVNANVINNTVSNTKLNAIAVSSGSNCATVTNNTVSSYGLSQKSGAMYGIMVWKAKGKSSKYIVIKGNKVNGKGSLNNRDGIRATASEYVYIKSNTIKNPDGHGVYVEAVKAASVKSNNISNSNNVGLIVVNCNGANVESNSLSGIKSDGIMVQFTSSANIKSNTVKLSADKTGIYVHGCAGAKIMSNKISCKTKSSGVIIAESPNHVNSGNVVY
ncbi:copper-binding protein (NosD) [Acetitomaculum ruminis DSM 5522]|uniref:Copper-binding protein (NosD) n=1 Tax=Acetitomaculum ruminis DSM 5522 TaxID=1120918 RepID=A0A1I0ZXG5_9FIRM|nr:right-handed parallel beta-helix repeat-containing protein [Acetitomaculum ruminis]SFB30042.1 copper-binding protein (NosD) [Acetitomaculum ruminis DSM 5522]